MKTEEANYKQLTQSDDVSNADKNGPKTIKVQSL